MFAFSIITVISLVTAASSHPLLQPKAPCRPMGNGTINIGSYQLYPENVDFDEQSCLLCKFSETQSQENLGHIGALYNASVVVYDPYEGSVVSTIEFANITRTPPFHIGGVAWDPYLQSRDGKSADEITILVDAAAAHETAGRDISGDNYLIRYSPSTHSVLWSTNLTRTSGTRYGGPQDIEHDARGNIYVLGTYPGTIQRVSRTGGLASEWFVPSTKPLDHAVVGYTGFAAVRDSSVLLVTDARNRSAEGGALYTFDMDASRGAPRVVPIAYAEADQVIRPADAIYLPRKYGGEVLLITEHDAVSVVRSRKGGGGKGEKSPSWRAAEFLGRIPNPTELASSGGLVTAAVEIGGRVYIVEEWFTDPLVPGTSAGNRTSFPLVDITAQLDALVNRH
ncbi:hypothetical protein F5B22DRAFT_657454 [Xylaria bambusicola]|uniref:uncharacterized protein n=1 Tax=Xylaria bambusicola TaxID=326684 RepID=UPI0020087F09|nr:uncharacterized protein F5B22DRAFT_657454 [Xylaria bambusicola]KAI0513037.1 hypothetical protein F5B22DRAFT_657454 [Xylaria bambusicola]